MKAFAIRETSCPQSRRIIARFGLATSGLCGELPPRWVNRIRNPNQQGIAALFPEVVSDFEIRISDLRIEPSCLIFTLCGRFAF
jgi:hypothetical protein